MANYFIECYGLLGHTVIRQHVVLSSVTVRQNELLTCPGLFML